MEQHHTGWWTTAGPPCCPACHLASGCTVTCDAKHYWQPVPLHPPALVWGGLGMVCEPQSCLRVMTVD